MASNQPEAASSIDELSVHAFSPHYHPSAQRIESLDVIKGIALLLGLFVTIYAWGGLSDGLQYQIIARGKGVRHVLFLLTGFFLDNKMRGLISLAFGAGMVLFLVRRHNDSTISNAELMIRRNMWLMLFGLFNAFVLLWPQDILFHLGIMGLLLYPFCRMNPRGLMIAVVIVSLIGAGKNYWYFSDDQTAYNKYLVVQSLEKKFSKDSAARMNTNDSLLFKKRKPGAAGVADSIANKKVTDSLAKKAGDTLTRKQNDEKQAWEGIAKRFTYDGKKDSANNKVMQETSYARNWNQLLPKAKNWESGWFYRNGVWEFAAIMLLGMFLFKIGFFTGRFSAGQYLMMLIISMVMGLFFAWYRLHFFHSAILDYTSFVKNKTVPYTIFWPFERAFIVFGIACKIMWLLQIGMVKKIMSVFADVGRLALTNYLLQSLFLSIFFYGYGMGYFARVSQLRLYFLVAEICLVQVVFSVFWLRYFYMGPAEWLLQSLMYKKKMPFVKKGEDSKLTPSPTFTTAI